MHRAAWDMYEIPWLGVDRLPADLECGGALQYIKGFVLEVVNVRRWASSGYRQSLKDEAASVRICARGEKAYPMPGPQYIGPVPAGTYFP